MKEMLWEGIQCMGIDGDWSVRREDQICVIHDYNTGPLHIGPVDLGWAVEFLEHIHPKYLGNVFATLQSCSTVFCTHALPGEQPIPYHVNVQSEDYWIAEFDKNGFALDEDATREVRAASMMARDFTRETGKVFRNTKERLSI